MYIFLLDFIERTERNTAGERNGDRVFEIRDNKRELLFDRLLCIVGFCDALPAE